MCAQSLSTVISIDALAPRIPRRAFLKRRALKTLLFFDWAWIDAERPKLPRTVSSRHLYDLLKGPLVFHRLWPPISCLHELSELAWLRSIQLSALLNLCIL
jgi:hypothetical protein